MDFSFPQYYQHHLKVHSYEVDLNQNLSIPGLFNFLQEIAWEHADKLKYGFDDLQDKGWIWVLSRVEVEIYDLPKWTEELTLVTWPRGAEGIFALRDFELYSSNGDKVMAASSSWIVLDINTRRPVRINDWYMGFEFADRSSIARTAAKISDQSVEPTFSEQFDVRIGDIDMNQHVNNVRYIDWAYNTFTIDHFKKSVPHKIIVNFNAEGKEGDVIKVERFNTADNNSIVNIGRVTDSKNLCKLEFFWKDKA
ncbi:MAG: acyl-[acyl-carrier-protein] thioesterase [Bacteroidales bacterium]